MCTDDARNKNSSDNISDVSTSIMENKSHVQSDKNVSVSEAIRSVEALGRATVNMKIVPRMLSIKDPTSIGGVAVDESKFKKIKLNVNNFL